ncbi:DUF167 family protein [Bdellovibrio sp. KM01]|uniref:DUF167 domain-containing protein n=1 Tax=Bdellovibrio sp. KM01 TaxID=2748865 RepID=UPI0015E9F7F1|nr:DUF167 family protein [Bdellovibrio sp. KM01]QLY25872.1 YggU family protein [Bdellovibrio sp. KM01]
MIEEIKGGVRLHLFIQPKSSKNQIVGPHNGMLKIKISAPPVDGEANTELIEYLAKFFKVPKRNVTLIKGDTGRQKTVDVEGISLSDAKALVTAAL